MAEKSKSELAKKAPPQDEVTRADIIVARLESVAKKRGLTPKEKALMAKLKKTSMNEETNLRAHAEHVVDSMSKAGGVTPSSENRMKNINAVHKALQHNPKLINMPHHEIIKASAPHLEEEIQIDEAKAMKVKLKPGMTPEEYKAARKQAEQAKTAKEEKKETKPAAEKEEPKQEGLDKVLRKPKADVSKMRVAIQQIKSPDVKQWLSGYMQHNDLPSEEKIKAAGGLVKWAEHAHSQEKMKKQKQKTISLAGKYR